MQIGDLEYEVSDRVATITLNRPAQFNAITARMPGNLVDAVERASNDHSVMTPRNVSVESKAALQSIRD